jgi:hypothetical protein
MEGEYLEEEDYNMLNNIRITNDEIVVQSTFRKYKLDITKVPKSEIADMVKLLKKQNYDNRFTIDIA